MVLVICSAFSASSIMNYYFGIFQNHSQFRKVSHVFACTGCHSLHLQPLAKKIANGNSVKYTPKTFDVSLVNRDGKCVHCKQSVHMAGPIYSAPIHNHQFVNRLLER